MRRHFFQERPGYHMIASSVTDPGWLVAVPGGGRAMVIAEGLLMYLSEDEVRELFGQMLDQFSGGLLAFDAFMPMAVRMAKFPTVAKMWAVRWGFDDPRLIEQWYPRLEFMAETIILDSPWIDKLPWLTRMALQAANRVPALRRMHRLLRYRF